MAVAKESVENEICDLMIADSNFDDVNQFIIGFLFKVPHTYYPICEVTINTETSPPELQQTGRNIRQFFGVIRFDVQIGRDVPTNTAHARKKTVPSYNTVQGFVNAAVQLFQTSDNRTLGGLNESGVWVVRQFVISSDAEYGVDSRSGRTDNWQNYGLIQFMCEIQEVRT